MSQIRLSDQQRQADLTNQYVCSVYFNRQSEKELKESVWELAKHSQPYNAGDWTIVPSVTYIMGQSDKVVSKRCCRSVKEKM